MNRIQSKNYRTGTNEINKMSCFDDKIYIQKNGYVRLALGYQSKLEKAIISIIYSKSCFAKHIILVFSQGTFFVKHITFEKRKVLRKKS